MVILMCLNAFIIFVSTLNSCSNYEIDVEVTVEQCIMCTCSFGRATLSSVNIILQFSVSRYMRIRMHIRIHMSMQI